VSRHVGEWTAMPACDVISSVSKFRGMMNRSNEHTCASDGARRRGWNARCMQCPCLQYSDVDPALAHKTRATKPTRGSCFLTESSSFFSPCIWICFGRSLGSNAELLYAAAAKACKPRSDQALSSMPKKAKKSKKGAKPEWMSEELFSLSQSPTQLIEIFRGAADKSTSDFAVPKDQVRGYCN
jgi:hypothetical protein